MEGRILTKFRRLYSPSSRSWTMNTAFPPYPNHTDWKTLYRAAILEGNNSVISQRVSEAETAVLARGRELLCSEEPPKREKPSRTHCMPYAHSGALGNTPKPRNLIDHKSERNLEPKASAPRRRAFASSPRANRDWASPRNSRPGLERVVWRIKF